MSVFELVCQSFAFPILDWVIAFGFAFFFCFTKGFDIIEVEV